MMPRQGITFANFPREYKDDYNYHIDTTFFLDNDCECRNDLNKNNKAYININFILEQID